MGSIQWGMPRKGQVTRCVERKHRSVDRKSISGLGGHAVFGGFRFVGEELSGFVQNALFLFIEPHHMVHPFDVFPEVSFVQFSVPDHLMQELQFPQCELLGEHLKGHALAVKLRPERGKGHVRNLIVVKSQRGKMVHIHPFGFSGKGGGFGDMVMKGHKPKVGHSDHSAVGEFAEGLQPASVLGILNPTRIPKCMELLEIDFGEPRQLVQSEAGGFSQRLMLLDNIARQSHLQILLLDTVLAIGALLDQQELKGLPVKPKQSTIHTDIHGTKIQGLVSSVHLSLPHGSILALAIRNCHFFDAHLCPLKRRQKRPPT